MGDLQDVMPRWKPWLPPKQDQAFQQASPNLEGGAGVRGLLHGMNARTLCNAAVTSRQRYPAI
jgi:hypothetical protein